MRNRNRIFTEYLDERLISSPDLSEMMSAVLAKGNQVRIRAKGRSMGPFIRNHDIVTIATIPGNKIKLGDIVAFTTSKKGNSFRLSLHRVVQLLDHESYLIKGDNTAKDPDGVVPRDRILGRVIKIERNNRMVRFGMGRERRLIAILSKHNILIPLVNSIRKIKRIFSQGKSQ